MSYTNIRGQDIESLPSSNDHHSSKCVGCGKEDSFSYTGRIIKGKQGGSKQDVSLSPIKVSGILESFDRSYPIIVGGRPEVVTKKFSYLITVRGRICRECAGDFRTIEHNGEFLPIVKVDSEVIGKTLGVERVLRVEAEDLECPPSKKQTPLRPSHQVGPKSTLDKKGDKQCVADNQWLNVGRRNKSNRG